jgi:vancomycin resistance protein YoaR
MRIPAFLLLLAAGGGLLAHLIFMEERVRAASQQEVHALGHAVPLGGEHPASQAKALAGAYLREPITLTFEGIMAVRPRGELGVTVATDALSALLRDAADAHSPLRKLHAQRKGRVLTLPIPAQLDAAHAEPWVRAFAARVDIPSRGARLDSNGQVTPARAGRALDVEATLDALQDAVFRGLPSATAVVRSGSEQSPPVVDKFDVKAVLGSFESEQAPDDAVRRQLLGQLARALDGTLLAPGQVFDFKAQTGLTRGFAPLPVGPVSIADGDRVEAAFAQVAGTVYASALFAGLRILEQHPRANPLSTLELGLECSLGQGENLRFQNDLPVPLALSVNVRDGKVRAALRGPSAQAREVDLSRLVEVAAPAPEIAHAEAGMPLGARTLIQRGLPSLHVTLARSIERGEERIERDATYLATPRVVKIGSGAEGVAPVALRADARPEYLVDEHLALTMRPGFELPEETARREGRTGVPGWTAPR